MWQSSSFPLQASATRPVSRTRCPMTGSVLRLPRDQFCREGVAATKEIMEGEGGAIHPR